MWKRLLVATVALSLQLACTNTSLPQDPPALASYNVRAFGARGDGETLDTRAINHAISAAHAAGGGTVTFPAGQYLSHSIHLQSNVNLYLGPGCVLIAAPASGKEGTIGYDPPEPNPWDHYEDFGHSHWHNSLLWGDDIENVSILGPGLIWGKGLSNGGAGRIDATTRPSATTEPTTPVPHDRRDTLSPTPRYLQPRPTTQRQPSTSEYPNNRDSLLDGVGNKSIALKNCRNITLRDFSILHGGHFGILATGVNNLTIDNLKIDTNRDGMDIDCCRNVRVLNCSVNSPWDDGICLKSCYGLGFPKSCDDVTIANCYVTGGYHEGTLLSGTFDRFPSDAGVGRTGRIKFGTESNAGFKRIIITNCVMDYCGGLAIESVDGAVIEDVTISNIAMRDIVNCPIFIRLGNRARGPDYPSPGVIRRVNISDVVCSNANWRYGSIISGIPGHPIEDLTLSNIRIQQQGGGTLREARLVPPELEDGYPEPTMFGTMPSSGFFIRHAKNVSIHDAIITTYTQDARPLFVLSDVNGADLTHIRTGVSRPSDNTSGNPTPDFGPMRRRTRPNAPAGPNGPNRPNEPNGPNGPTGPMTPNRPNRRPNAPTPEAPLPLLALQDVTNLTLHDTLGLPDTTPAPPTPNHPAK